MKVKPIYGELPFRQPDVDHWNEFYKDPEYRITFDALGCPEDAFLDPIYDRYTVELFADNTRLSHVPTTPVDFVPILANHVYLDWTLRSDFRYQLITTLSGEWSNVTVSSVIHDMKTEGVDVKAFVYGTDCHLEYDEEVHAFEISECRSTEVERKIKKALHDIQYPFESEF